MSFTTLLRPTIRAASSNTAPLRLHLRALSSSAPAMSDKLVLSSRSPSNNVAVLTLNRPKAKNALSSPLFEELNAELEKADQDDGVRAIVITGGDKVFAAGADIKEMKDKTFAEAYRKNFLGSWGKLASVQKPIIGAVAGFALGGGCELALMTDILITTPDAKFGQPEITLGIIPGGGGTQRLAKVIGKARTMDLVLTNRWITGEEAGQWGLASRVTKEGESVVDVAIKVGDDIAAFGAVAAQAGKEAVNAALELPLQEGLRFERRLFHSLFSTADQKEGMGAFVEKRKPTWEHSKAKL